MCFVRKGLDKVFTYNELKWLDDILPGTPKPWMGRTCDILSATPKPHKGTNTKENLSKVNRETPTKMPMSDEENNALIATNGTVADNTDTSPV